MTDYVAWREKALQDNKVREELIRYLEARIAELERRVKFLEDILACPKCYAIMENRHSCIFCGWKEQP